MIDRVDRLVRTVITSSSSNVTNDNHIISNDINDTRDVSKVRILQF